MQHNKKRFLKRFKDKKILLMEDSEIILPEHRKNKNDDRAKRKFWRYKKGGHERIRLKEKDGKNI